MATLPTLGAYLTQVKMLPAEIQRSEVTLIALGRQLAESFDKGDRASGVALRGLLSDLRRLTKQWERLDAIEQRSQSQLDAIRDRRSTRLSG